MSAILYKGKVYGAGGSIIEGYYKVADGKFYEESTYETEIPGAEDLLYIDLTSKMQFIFDGTNFVNITEDAKPTVTEASSRTNIASGDTLKTIIGKIKKFFADLKTVAFTGAYSDLSGIPTIPTITDTYSGTSSDGMSGKAVKSAIDALDGTVSGSAGAGKTLTAFSQTDGKVSATFGNISITKSQVSDMPTKLSDFTDDVVSGNYVKTSNSGAQTIRTTASSGDTAVRLRSNAADSWLAFYDSSNSFIGSIGAKSDKRPYFYDGTSSAGTYPILLNGDTFVYKAVELPEANAPITAGWRRVCKIATKVGYANGFIMMNGGYENITPTTAVIAFSCMYNKSRFFLVNSSNLGAIKKIRTVYVSGGTFWIDVYIENAATTGKQGKQRLIFFGNFEISDIQNSMAVYTDTVTVNYELEIPSSSTIAGIPVVSKRGEIQYIENTGGNTPLRLKGNTTFTYLSYRDSSDNHLGSIGVTANHKPSFSYNNVTTDIALISDITDEKITLQSQNPSSSSTYFALFASDGANQKPYANNGFRYNCTEGTTSSDGIAQIYLGNATGTGTAANKRGYIRMYGAGTKYTQIQTGNNGTSSNITITLPSSTGTLALTKDFLPLTGGGSVAGDVHFTGQLYAEGWGLVIGTSSSRGQAYFVQGNYAIQIYPYNLSADRIIVIPDTSGTFNVSGSSSRRTKKNIENMTDAEAKKLLDLRPVKFDYITEEDGTDCYGLIAEEVQDAGIEYPLFTHHDKRLDEDVPALEYSKFVPYLIKMVQLQQQEIDLLKQEIATLKGGTP